MTTDMPMVPRSDEVIALADISTTYIDPWLSRRSASGSKSVQLPQVSSEHIAFLQSAQTLAGDIGQTAIALLGLVKEMQSAQLNTAVALRTLNTQLEMNTQKIEALSKAVSFLQVEISKIPNDYANPDLMRHKTYLIDKMCDISIKLALL